MSDEPRAATRRGCHVPSTHQSPVLSQGHRAPRQEPSRSWRKPPPSTGPRGRSVLNRCANATAPSPGHQSLSRGCELGCRYCYARYTTSSWAYPLAGLREKIYVKRNAPDPPARADAARSRASRSPWHRHRSLPAAERRYRVTRSLLEVMVHAEAFVSPSRPRATWSPGTSTAPPDRVAERCGLFHHHPWTGHCPAWSPRPARSAARRPADAGGRRHLYGVTVSPVMRISPTTPPPGGDRAAQPPPAPPLLERPVPQAGDRQAFFEFLERHAAPRARYVTATPLCLLDRPTPTGFAPLRELQAKARLPRRQPERHPPPSTKRVEPEQLPLFRNAELGTLHRINEINPSGQPPTELDNATRVASR